MVICFQIVATETSNYFRYTRISFLKLEGIPVSLCFFFKSTGVHFGEFCSQIEYDS